jgi:anti-sigma B factor antagonist
MELNIKKINQATVVNIIGDIDGKTAGEIQEQILPQIQAGSKVLLDMSRVEYMSSAGLRMLLSMYRQVKGNDGRIALVGLSEEIQDIMSTTGFLSHFTTCSSVDEGLNALREEE